MCVCCTLTAPGVGIVLALVTVCICHPNYWDNESPLGIEKGTENEVKPLYSDGILLRAHMGTN